MSGVPILYQNTFIINSYYCEYTTTSNITYYLNVDEEYLNKVNRIAVTKIYIPNKIFQFDYSDYLVLTEGLSDPVNVHIGNKTYATYTDMANDLGTLLSNASPNSYTYTCTIVPNTNNCMLISVNNITTVKQITVNNKHLEIAFGISGTIQFIDSFQTNMLTLSPIDMIFVNSNAVLNYNTNTIGASILTVFDLNDGDYQPMQQTDLLTASKPFNNIKRLQFILTDFDNDVITLEGNKHWWMEIQLFYYNEDYIEKQKMFIDLKTFDLLKQKELENFNDNKHMFEEEKKNLETIAKQNTA